MTIHTFNPAVTRYPLGVTNTTVTQPFGNYPDADPTKLHVFFDDFDTFNTAKWTVTETQAGATQALTDGDGGQILLTNSAANNDINAIRTVSTPVVFDTTKKHWFKCRFKVDDASLCNFVAGVMNGTIFALTEGIVMYNAGSGSINFNATDTTTTQIAGLTTAVANTFVEVAWYYDGAAGASGSGKAFAYIDGVLKGVTTLASTDIPNTASFIVFGIQNLSAAARNATCDYLFFAQER